MSATPQLELFSPKRQPDGREVEWFIGQLREVGWRRSEEVLRAAGLPTNDAGKRRLRLLANMSGGRIAGGQKGYKLVEEMTAEEFAHWQNWMASQEKEMAARRIAGQRVFYSRTNLAPAS
jgi:hypothetical protein